MNGTRILSAAIVVLTAIAAAFAWSAVTIWNEMHDDNDILF